MAGKEEEGSLKPVTVEINKLKFTYPGINNHPPPGSSPLIDDFSLTLHSRNSCLLIESNGTRKTTILKIVSGKHLVELEIVWILGRFSFHDTTLTVSGELCYVEGKWRREIAFARFEVAIQMDVSAEKMVFNVLGVDPQR